MPEGGHSQMFSGCYFLESICCSKMSPAVGPEQMSLVDDGVGHIWPTRRGHFLSV